jgi:hypothetical protein
MAAPSKWWAVFIGIATVEALLLIKLLMGRPSTELLVAIGVTTVLLVLTLRIEDLVKVQLGKEGMSVELAEKVKQVEEKQGEISDIQIQQQKEIEHIAGFLVSNLLSRHERGLLKTLASDRPFPYTDKTSFEKDLKRLRELCLVKSSSDSPLNIRDIPQSSNNLKSFVSISERGCMCLKFMKLSSLGNQSDGC